ncbi:phosphomevalonate kinase [Marinilactibacillus kalidii]|uniref:phosphomevalonate kinase n=1 Tax=Marinilactibacillus kalidii TaxID=2820274 RepID=UPI001ABDEE1A|nr:phosphomevalonate kinase [Marinilactibacillus kalidii]
MNQVEASAPGKLYIAGEYAVVEPGHPAILVAVDQFLTVKVRPSETVGTIHSSHYSSIPLQWTRENGKLIVDERENPFHYLLAAIDYTERYVKECGNELSIYHLAVESELDSANGLKYGLGSSAAVTVATVRVLLKFYGMSESDELVFKLSVLAHLSVKSNGSFGDIAAATYTGWLAYSSFDREWVKAKLNTHSIQSIVALDWPAFMVEKLTPPDNLKLLIGWTGSPASTTDLVDQVKAKREAKAQSYQAFLAESKACVEQMIQAFRSGSLPDIQIAIRKNRHILKTMSDSTGVSIETSTLAQLCEDAESYQGAAKSSGAGGGDCGIALFDRESSLIDLVSKWEAHQITLLPLQVYTRS